MGTSGRAEPEGGANHAPATIANSLEQVREILVGAQHRELVRRMARMDARIAAQGEELRAETRRRLEALEQHVTKECEALGAAIEAQRSAQIDAQSAAAREARDVVALLEQRVKRLEEVNARSQRELRQQLLDQAKSFIDEVRRLRDELGMALEREIQRVHGAAELPAGEPFEGGQHEPWEPPSEAA